MKQTTAVILAAGQGTRMKSQLPKVLHQVAGKAMIQWVLDCLTEANFKHKIAVLGHKAEAVAQAVGDQAQVVYQTEQLGTGHAVMQATAMLAQEPGCVLVVCGDTPLLTSETIQALVDQHHQQGNAVTVLTALASNPFGYGRIVRQGEQIKAIVEEKDASSSEKLITEINAGTYCFDQRFLLEGLQQLTTDNAQGEYYLTDLIKIAVLQQRAVNGYLLADFEESLGVNNRVQLAQAEKIMVKRQCQRLMLAGVTIIDPDHTYINGAVTVGEDTIIYPGVTIEGETVIGRQCVIGANSRIVNSRIGDGTHIQMSIIMESVVGQQCNIGPFAYLRPGSCLKDQVKIGDFVEVKKSTIGEGSKVPHLSYIGDAIIGEGVNIGCGTITCNYDGKNKHQTIINDGAFIGSNTNLIAPVVIGRQATIGAGSTISKDIWENSLAFTRAALTVKENWRKHK